MSRTTARGDDKADEIFDFIVQHKEAYDGNSPFIREIMRECDLSTTSLVTYYLKRLQRAGLLELKERRILVVGGKWTLETGE